MVELAPRLGTEALLGIDHNVIDLAVLIRVLRQPEGMPVLAIPQGPVLGIATRYHPAAPSAANDRWLRPLPNRIERERPVA